jgi:hypothetical protein
MLDPPPSSPYTGRPLFEGSCLGTARKGDRIGTRVRKLGYRKQAKPGHIVTRTMKGLWD